MFDNSAPEPVGEVTEVFTPTFCSDEEREIYNKVKESPEIIDVKGNGAILKQILVAGPEDAEVCPQSDATVYVHYTGKLLNGTVFDSSVTRGQPFNFDIGNMSVIRGWDEGVCGMRVGEKALFTIVSDYAYGSKGSGSIPADATLQFEIELLDVVEKDHEYPHTNDEKLAAAKVRQEAGNALFKSGKYKKAAAKYDKGTQLLEYFIDSTPEMEEERCVLRATLFGNWALCNLRMKDYADCCSHAREGMKILEEKEERATKNVELRLKLCQRVGRGALGAGRSTEARKYISMGLDIAKTAEQTDKVQEFENDLKKCDAQIALEARKQQDIYKRLMANMGK